MHAVPEAPFLWKEQGILRMNQGKVQAAFENTDGDREAMRETMLKIDKDTQVRLAGILDEDQMKRYQELMAQRRERMRERRAEGEGRSREPS